MRDNDIMVIDITEQEEMPFLVMVGFDDFEGWCTVLTMCEYSPTEIYYSSCDTEATPEDFRDAESTSHFINYEIDDKGFSCGSYDIEGMYEEIMNMGEPLAVLLYNEFRERFHKGE